VGELTASIAHEVNQPLGAIRSNADTAEMCLTSGTASMSELRDILTDIRNDAHRASEVIRRVRTLLRKPELRPEALDLDELATEVAGLVKYDARQRDVGVSVQLREAGPRVTADKVCLQQVLMNFLINGMDAVANQPAEHRRLTIASFATDTGEAGVAVSDSGPGIPAELMPRLFDSFFTIKSDGMGLGLSLARSLVQANDGRIWAENNAEGGATFRFALPADMPGLHERATVGQRRGSPARSLPPFPKGDRGGFCSTLVSYDAGSEGSC